jgi:hypothetical protein
MKANYRNEFEGIEVNIIRPLVYVREADTRDFSLRSHLPVINENCPACFEQPKVPPVPRPLSFAMVMCLGASSCEEAAFSGGDHGPCALQQLAQGIAAIHG